MIIKNKESMLQCVGQRILIQRNKNKLTQFDLAHKLGISQEAVSRYETEKSLPPAESIVQLAVILNVSTDYLLGLSDQEQSVKSLGDLLSTQEWELLTTFRRLPGKARQRALGYMQGAAENQ